MGRLGGSSVNISSGVNGSLDILLEVVLVETINIVNRLGRQSSVKSQPPAAKKRFPEHQTGANQTKVAVIRAVAESEGAPTAGEIAVRCGLSRPTVDACLNRLRRAKTPLIEGQGKVAVVSRSGGVFQNQTFKLTQAGWVWLEVMQRGGNHV